ncbi:hypothetical protein [Archangium sp.]|uniref:hypothetical protein n=1 Tax=Archangium sp. TaxID=1872627 RepID=UPI002D6CB1EB|nr:hypothetical protein [Archangium sp.]HYO53515.1 hypothetical protein [Archangium sp.]
MAQPDEGPAPLFPLRRVELASGGRVTLEFTEQIAGASVEVLVPERNIEVHLFPGDLPLMDRRFRPWWSSPGMLSCPSMASIRLAITGLGLVSTIGNDVVSACASLRAGITRPAPLDFQVASSEDLSVEAVMGHPMVGVTDGFTGLGLYVHLASLALQDLLAYGRLDARDVRFWRDTALFVGTSPVRDEEQEDFQQLLDEHLCAELVRRAGLDIPPENRRRIALGHASVLSAANEAAEAVARGRVRRALVLGVDSLVGEDELLWLASLRRLKTPEHAVGLMPGEAAAAILLESETEARLRQATPAGLLTAVTTGAGESELGSRARIAQQGLHLSRVIEETASRATRIHAVYGDLNGEEARAREWGMALVRLSQMTQYRGAREYWPATCMGDTGAASGAIAMALACRNFIRNPASGDTALIWSRADSGVVASALVSRA